MTSHPKSAPPRRRIFCNRTLNLTSIDAIGYDMDYTLVHYNVKTWEGRAYEHIRERLLESGQPVDDCSFEPGLVMRGLVIDRELGNVIKVDRFGYIKQAMHGRRMLDYRETRRIYARTLVDLADARFDFLNTLFSLSEACMYIQMVELLDAGRLKQGLGYRDLYKVVGSAVGYAHLEGRLKAEIMADPEHFVELDPEVPISLLDQKKAGKKLLVITNSEWNYTRFMLDYAFNRYLPDGMTWRELFDFTVIAARKPAFFIDRTPILRILNDQGHLEPVVGAPTTPGVYFGGHAALIEQALGVSGDRILYVGDHIYGDVNVSKKLQRWRTALILRELERELRAIEHSHDDRIIIAAMMNQKTRIEHEINALRLERQHLIETYGERGTLSAPELDDAIGTLRSQIQEIDKRLAPLLDKDGRDFSKVWGHLMRTGNDKSHLTRQVERHADIYTSRVSNFLFYTPFAYFRSSRGSMPHIDEG